MFQNGKIGCLNILPITINSLGEDNYNTISDSRGYKSWNDLGIDENVLSEQYAEIGNWGYISNYCHNIGELDWRKGDLLNAEMKEVEDSDCFNYPYVFCFNKYLAEYGCIPNGNEFWEYWCSLNIPYINNCLVGQNCNMMEQSSVLDKLIHNAIVEKSGLTEKSYNELYEKSDKEQYIKKIKLASEYRAKKFHCAILRELYLGAFLAKENDNKSFIVWCHPVIDVIFKADFIVNVPWLECDNTRILCAYLDTEKSRCRAKGKSNNMPQSFINKVGSVVSAPIEQDFNGAYQKNTIILPLMESMKKLCRVLQSPSEELLNYRGVYYRQQR